MPAAWIDAPRGGGLAASQASIAWTASIRAGPVPSAGSRNNTTAASRRSRLTRRPSTSGESSIAAAIASASAAVTSSPHDAAQILASVADPIGHAEQAHREALGLARHQHLERGRQRRRELLRLTQLVEGLGGSIGRQRLGERRDREALDAHHARLAAEVQGEPVHVLQDRLGRHVVGGDEERDDAVGVAEARAELPRLVLVAAVGEDELLGRGIGRQARQLARAEDRHAHHRRDHQPAAPGDGPGESIEGLVQHAAPTDSRAGEALRDYSPAGGAIRPRASTPSFGDWRRSDARERQETRRPPPPTFVIAPIPYGVRPRPQRRDRASPPRVGLGSTSRCVRRRGRLRWCSRAQRGESASAPRRGDGARRSRCRSSRRSRVRGSARR